VAAAPAAGFTAVGNKLSGAQVSTTLAETGARLTRQARVRTPRPFQAAVC